MDLERYRGYMEAQNFSPLTIDARIRYIKRVTIDLDSLSQETFHKVAHWLYHQPVSNESKNHFARAINTYFKMKGILYRLKLKRMKGDVDIQIPTEKEKEELLNYTWNGLFINLRNRFLLKTLFLLGIRRGEAQQMTYSWFRRDVRSDRTYYHCSIVGKGNKRRKVEIPEWYWKELMEYKRITSNGPFLFHNGRGKALHPNSISRICREARKRTGVPYFRTHSARHFRAVELFKQDISKESIRRFLGHSKGETTELYLRGYKDSVRDELYQKDKEFKRSV